MLRSREIQSLEVFEMRCLRLLEVLPRRTDYTISRSDRTPLSMNLSHMSSDTEDSGGLGMFGICKELTSLAKHTNMTSKDRKREEDH